MKNEKEDEIELKNYKRGSDLVNNNQNSTIIYYNGIPLKQKILLNSFKFCICCIDSILLIDLRRVINDLAHKSSWKLVCGATSFNKVGLIRMHSHSYTKMC